MKRLLLAVGMALGIFRAAVLYRTCFHDPASATTIVHAEVPVAEFTISRGPRLVLLPVTLNDRTFMFCVDTGAWKTIFDSSLRARLGESLGTTTAATPSGFLQVEMFRCPQASVGSLDLSSIESVGCDDLTKMRYASGQEIYGILGMDFLKNFAVEFNFDAGKCRIWQSAPQSWLQEHSAPLTYDESSRPQVKLVLPGNKAEQFVIDTGANASTLRSDVFDELVQKGDIQPAIAHGVVAMAGTFRAQSGYVNELHLESFSQSSIRLDRDPFSTIGVRYLSRYSVRLNFIDGKAYFAAGNRFSTAEQTATGGLAILQMNGEKVVCAVEPAGPAAASGIVPGDVIVAVDGRDAHQHDMVSLHEVLTRGAGASVPLLLNRNGQTYEVAVRLESRLAVRR